MSEDRLMRNFEIPMPVVTIPKISLAPRHKKMWEGSGLLGRVQYHDQRGPEAMNDEGEALDVPALIPQQSSVEFHWLRQKVLSCRLHWAQPNFFKGRLPSFAAEGRVNGM
ncbi:hypothetical protein PV04_06924 [Phialophora macrospora]|uniref:Uncharacterized protein n=1 Tax=Phialophora macrospora TaxID=1851006 RepID=A0A0D2DZX7_9EURO|nr:hypothetical protein PV04_06924 [Phialophora macrospora]